MKKLLESYKSIIENNYEQNQSNSDLASDMIKFNMNFTAKAKLIPFDSKHERKICDNCVNDTIIIKSGAFCSKCGFVFPF